MGKLVPWTYCETVVAAEDAVANGLAVSRRDVPLMLDGEVRDAGARVDLIRRGEGSRRANVETAAAGPAAILFRCVRLNRGAGEDRADEQPRAKLARHEIGVLALPAEARARGERLLHYRRGVHEDLNFAAKKLLHPNSKRLELGFEDVVIVGA